MKNPPAEELSRVSAAEAAAAERLRRDLAERAALPESDPSAEPKPLDPSLRLEAVLIERRIDQLARRDVQAARLEPSAIIYKTLGPYPHADPDKALAWQDGAHALATYRRRHDVRDETSPLGAPAARRGGASRARPRATPDRASPAPAWTRR